MRLRLYLCGPIVTTVSTNVPAHGYQLLVLAGWCSSLSCYIDINYIMHISLSMSFGAWSVCVQHRNVVCTAYSLSLDRSMSDSFVESSLL
jgi:hypothetical protein